MAPPFEISRYATVRQPWPMLFGLCLVSQCCKFQNVQFSTSFEFYGLFRNNR